MLTITPTTTRRQYDAEVARLNFQLEVAQRIVAAYNANWSDDHTPIEEPLYTAWNAAHDAVTGLEHMIRQLDIDFAGRKVDPSTRALVAQNID